jgi:phage terminase small subunit
MTHRGRKSSYDFINPVVELPIMTRKPTNPAGPPSHLSPQMATWWRQVVAENALEPHHLLLLQSACESFDRAQSARLQLAAEGLTTIDKSGIRRAHPAVAVEHTSRAAFARLVKALALDPPPDRQPGGIGWIPGGRVK